MHTHNQARFADNRLFSMFMKYDFVRCHLLTTHTVNYLTHPIKAPVCLQAMLPRF